MKTPKWEKEFDKKFGVYDPGNHLPHQMPQAQSEEVKMFIQDLIDSKKKKSVNDICKRFHLIKKAK